MNARVLTLAAVLAVFAGHALSHHSFSMFDRGRTVTLEGTIKSLDWVNPHALIHLDIREPPSRPVEWLRPASIPKTKASGQRARFAQSRAATIRSSVSDSA